VSELSSLPARRRTCALIASLTGQNRGHDKAGVVDMQKHGQHQRLRAGNNWKT